MEYSVCVLAGGQGSRTKLQFNKAYFILTDLKDPEWKTVLDQSLEVFIEDEDCKQIVLACPQEEMDFVKSYYKGFSKIEIVQGGTTRQGSVYNALKCVRYPYVMIHDAARPYLTCEMIEALKKTLNDEKACLLMIPSTDTVKIVQNGYVVQTPERKDVYQAQTPQCFQTELIRDCHEKALHEQRVATDDAQLVEWYSEVPIKVVQGDSTNIKITLPQDLL